MTEVLQLLDQGRLAFALVILSYGAISDLRKREVSNGLWILGLPVGFILTSLSLALRFEFQALLMLLASAGASFLLGLALFYVGFAGGADAKALFFLGLSLPLYPEGGFEPLSPVLPLFPLTVFNNALLLSLSVPGLIALKNLLRVLRGKRVLGEVKAGLLGRFVLFVSSYRVTISNLREKVYLNPAERPFQEKSGIVRRPVYFTSAEADRERVVEEIEAYAAKGLYDDGILASPTLPMVFFMSIGLILALFGDIALFIALQIVAL